MQPTLLSDEPGWRCWVVGGGSAARRTNIFRRTQTRRGRIGDCYTRHIPRSTNGCLAFCEQPTSIVSRTRVPSRSDCFCRSHGRRVATVVTTAMGGAMEIVDETCGVLAGSSDGVALASILRILVRQSCSSANERRGGYVRLDHSIRRRKWRSCAIIFPDSLIRRSEVGLTRASVAFAGKSADRVDRPCRRLSIRRDSCTCKWNS